MTVRERAQGLWHNRHLRLIGLVTVVCTVFYYLPPIAGLAGGTSMEGALGVLHDFYGLVFFVPVVYAAYVFGIRGVFITAILSMLIILPYAAFISPYSDGLLRATALAIILSAVGAAIAMLQKGDDERRKSERELKYLCDVGKAAEKSESLEVFLSSMIELVSKAVEHPGDTKVRIEVDDRVVESTGFEREALESVVTIPLRSKGTLHGTLTLGCTSGHRLSPQEIELLNSIADQIAVGIANSELYEETRQNVEWLAVVGEIAKAIASSTDIDEVFRTVTAGIGRLVEFDQASIHLVDREAGTMRVLALSRDIESGLGEGVVMPLEGSGTEWVVEHMRPRIEDDLASKECPFSSDNLLLAYGFVSLVQLPLVAKGRAFGTFNVRSRRPHAFGGKEAEFLERISNQLAIALENAALISQVRLSGRQMAGAGDGARVAQDTAAQSEQLMHLSEVAEEAVRDLNDALSSIVSRARQALEDARGRQVRANLEVIEKRALNGANTVRRLQDIAAVGPDVAPVPLDVAPGGNGERERGAGTGHDVDPLVGAGLFAELDQVSPFCGEAEIREAVMNILLNAMREGGEAGHGKGEKRVNDNGLSLTVNAVAVIDLEGDMIYVNRSFLQMWGYYSDKDVLERPAREFWQVEAGAADILGPLLRYGNWQGELKARKKDGTLFDVQMWASTVGEGDKPICIMASFIDITERMRTERELKESFNKLRQTLQETVDTLTRTIEKRDPYTARHQQRVTRLACAIAQEMGLSQQQVDTIRIAGILHDIGKVHIPTEVLAKPIWLSDIEKALVKTHPQIGYDIVSMLPFEGPVAQIILQHHEMLDGSGYPSGLHGEEILLEARVLAVADVVEAMSSSRPYRSVIGTERAVEEISQKRGTLYDPRAVDACIKLIQERGFKFD